MAIAAVWLLWLMPATAAAKNCSFPDVDIDPCYEASSGDGSRVFFTSTRSFVPQDTNGVADVYERTGGHSILVSEDQTGSAAGGRFGGISRDGSRVFFVSSAQLVSADIDAFQDVYERAGGTTTRISLGPINSNTPFDADFEAASTSGARVIFSTEEQLVTTDTDAARDLYSRSASGTVRISQGDVNGNGLHAATFQDLSDNGNRVTFITDEPLMP